jgi:two-component system, response regulator PdtaR
MTQKILIVEDENIIALDIKTRLRRMGYKILSVVHSGEKAVDMVKQQEPDLILMDVVLRGKLNGIEAAEKISSIKTIPIIFITAYSDAETITKILKITPYGYLIKPFDERELDRKIKKIFSESSFKNERLKNNFMAV